MKAFPPNPKKQVKLPTNRVAGRERSPQLSPTFVPLSLVRSENTLKLVSFRN